MSGNCHTIVTLSVTMHFNLWNDFPFSIFIQLYSKMTTYFTTQTGLFLKDPTEYLRKSLQDL